ncbi:zinc finger protein 420-like [Cydia strobilella]|uniref:zinc finger protein 420-like n=1 Tax=Cydia strobilella TaxID=1100964 RepID=UPI0030060E82
MVYEDDSDIKKCTRQDQGKTIDKDDTDGLTDVLDDFEEITKTLNDAVDLDLSDDELDINDGSPFIDRAKTFNVEELFRGKINNDLNDISSKNINNDIGDIISKAFKGKDKVCIKKSNDKVNNLIAVKNEDTSSTFRDAEEVLKANINDLPSDLTFNDISMNANDLNDNDSNLVDTFNNFILDHDYFDEKFLLETGDSEFMKKHVISKKTDEDSLLREIIPNMTKKDEIVIFKEREKTKNKKTIKPVKNLLKLKLINKGANLNNGKDISKASNNKDDKTFKIEDESTSNEKKSTSEPIITKPELPIDDNIKTELSKEFIKFGSDFNFRIFELSKEEQLEEIQKKREGVLYVSAPYKCVNCAKGFKSMTTYENHLKVHEPSYGPFSCDICHSRHKSEARRRRHADTHRFKYCCTRCEVVARSRERAEAHFHWHAGKTFPCRYCGEQFGKASTHLSHIRLRHPAACVWCSQCGDPFVGALGLRQHMRRRHPTVANIEDSVELYCFTCRMQFQNSDAYLRHKEASGTSCRSDQRFCASCGDSFESEKALLHHRKLHANAPAPCHMCPAWFTSSHSRETHYLRAHLGASTPRAAPRHPRPRRPAVKKPAMCELCGKKYHSAAALSYHQRSHTGEKPFACTRCPKSFALNHSLQAHIRTHTGERPYRCSRCPRAFLNANNLARHKKTVHLGQKQYSRCAVCRRWLSSPSAARLHAAAVHGAGATHNAIAS